MSVDPFAQAIPAFKPPSVTRPLVFAYKEVRVIQNDVTVAVCAAMLLWDISCKGLSYATAFWIISTLTAYAIRNYVSKAPATLEFLEFYDKFLLSCGSFFYAFAAICNWVNYDDHFFTLTFILLPAYHFPQYYQTWSVAVLFSMHTAAVVPFYSSQQVIVVATICECIFRFGMVRGTAGILELTREAEQAVEKGSKDVRTRSTECQMMYLQIRDLLERGFDGIVLIQDGIVKWGNDKFFDHFQTIEVGMPFQDAFDKEHYRDVEQAYKGESIGWLPTKENFKCTFVVTPSPDSSAKIAGIRVRKDSDERASTPKPPNLEEGGEKRSSASMVQGAIQNNEDVTLLQISIDGLKVVGCSGRLEARCGKALIGAPITKCTDVTSSTLINNLSYAVQKGRLSGNKIIELCECGIRDPETSATFERGKLYLWTQTLAEEHDNTFHLIFMDSE